MSKDQKITTRQRQTAERIADQMAAKIRANPHGDYRAYETIVLDRLPVTLADALERSERRAGSTG